MATKLLSSWGGLFEDVGVFETPVVLQTNTRQLVSRVVSGLVLISLGWLITVSGLVDPYGDDFVWVVYTIGAIMLLLAAGSIQPALGVRIAQMAVPLYCTAASLTVYSALSLFIFTPRDALRVLSLHVMPLAMVGTDVALGALVEFRLRHLVVPQLFMLAHSVRFLGGCWIRHGFFASHIIPSRVARHGVLLAASVGVVLASNLAALLRPAARVNADCGEQDALV